MSGLTTRTLGELVEDVPARAAVLERLGLDYCCHGQRSLAEACSAAGLDDAQVAAQLAVVDDAEAAAYPADPAGLADYIEATHHAYLHAELPHLDALAAKVVAVHGERHPELAAVGRLVAGLRSDLEPHLTKEEHMLFPAIRALASGSGAVALATVRTPIRMMAAEHDRAGELLAELRTATRDFQVPADGCASYQSFYARLEHLEADTHRHIHLENNVLFPAAMSLEDSGDRRNGR